MSETTKYPESLTKYVNERNKYMKQAAEDSIKAAKSQNQKDILKFQRSQNLTTILAIVVLILAAAIAYLYI
ncbi:hypothetical protein TVAG_092110 [Trichomonas vaginalis G3]|uniref:Uncharacterized protein n=1 Tax=Trichomonas vaginalis (strain ATCC PRA-98 / G3) TaxID=412133 RepID=A2FWG8_TRIV3|nr:hypothetical protein TVAGG3_0481760 [Trichomonas vaginalis G3]EAX90738.1 hypothetical protein TVAG_092110 [Trichomonas vaginalis G3]KAI5515757.1 hypothetical protein TVAGG3_0481760 [Trichomonas vaginalis G3]|eukprot:XP_001303668.1 hypothetical protein [Trichomonas vaginalis G3]